MTGPDYKTSLPPLAKIISPKQSPSNLNMNQDTLSNLDLHSKIQSPIQQVPQNHQTQQVQPSLFYPAASNPAMSESNVLKSMNDFSNQLSQSNSSQHLPGLYQNLNLMRPNSNDSSHQSFLNQENLDLSNNDLLRQRQQSPLINNFYHNLQPNGFRQSPNPLLQQVPLAYHHQQQQRPHLQLL